MDDSKNVRDWPILTDGARTADDGVQWEGDRSQPDREDLDAVAGALSAAL